MKSEDIFSWQNKYCVRITFISGKHRYHNTGEAAGLIEPLDERVAEFLKRLIRQGTKNAKELQRRALEYVKESLFSGESHPDATRRKFRPNRQKIRNLVSSVRNELGFSKTGQENLQHLAKEWRKWGDVHFLPRYLVCYYSFNRNPFYITL